MSDLISRQDAIDALGEEPLVWDENDDYDVATRNQWRYDVECIKEVPSIERKGSWVGIDGEFCETFECDRCGFVLEDWIQGAFYNFCPNCGADMRGENDERA